MKITTITVERSSNKQVNISKTSLSKLSALRIRPVWAKGLNEIMFLFNSSKVPSWNYIFTTTLFLLFLKFAWECINNRCFSVRLTVGGGVGGVSTY